MGAAAGGKEGKVESEPPRSQDGLEQDKNLNRLTRTARTGDGPIGVPTLPEKDFHALSRREQAVHPARC
jgi:hypothetical protein